MTYEQNQFCNDCNQKVGDYCDVCGALSEHHGPDPYLSELFGDKNCTNLCNEHYELSLLAI